MSMTIGLDSNTYSLLHQISRLYAERDTIMTRLATGKRMNTAADDPSGMVIATALNSDLVKVNAALNNNQRSKAVLDTADASLTEISGIMAEIERLANAAKDPNVTSAQKSAYQASIDQYLDTVDNLITTTEYGGKKIFTGTNAIAATTTQVKYKDVRVYSAANAAADKNFSVAFTAASKDVTVDGTVVGKANANGDEVVFTKDGYTVAFVVTDVSANIVATNITVTKATGMLFQTGTDSTSQTRLDVGAGVTTAELGDFVQGYLSSLRTGGANALAVDGNKAAEIASKASQQVSSVQARVGSFSKYQIESAINVLQASADGLQATYNSIVEADTAQETARLERNNALLNAALTMLSLAGSKQSTMLSLLG